MLENSVHKKKNVPHQQIYHTKTRGSALRELRPQLLYEALSYYCMRP
jgi:hypothetical protein